ncbi:unnamed protein product [Prorocentrum cordatum]|uniref:Pyrrolo-quinoline quinone repeat domain-containing protein n=1 Tax=Prorocentrum cordatum TaxID=2364126 RepID=A0ABN9SS74_9DINO|nr:unnamed protein product [Polarella glacialis]
MSAVIRWQSGREGRTPVDSMKETLRLFSPKSTVERSSSILVGSTTSGYVFAIDIATGNEVWTTVASSQIAGVKGTVSGSGGKVFVATNRCVDRYCYRYRSTTNPLTPGNTYVRALNAVDGSQIWAFKPKSPLWNFVPQFGGDGGTVMFNDYEGAVYSLNIETGALIWRAEGAMGTHTQSSCVYSSELNQVFAMGVNNYEGEFCNPYVPKGIQPACGTQVDAPGWVRALNASSGKVQWETGLPQPPASAAVGFLNTPRPNGTSINLGVLRGFLSSAQDPLAVPPAPPPARTGARQEGRRGTDPRSPRRPARVSVPADDVFLLRHPKSTEGRIRATIRGDPELQVLLR